MKYVTILNDSKEDVIKEFVDSWNKKYKSNLKVNKSKTNLYYTVVYIDDSNIIKKRCKELGYKIVANQPQIWKDNKLISFSKSKFGKGYIAQPGGMATESILKFEK